MQNKTNPNEETWEEVNPESQETWDFKKEDTIQGTYVGMKINVGPNNSNIYVIQFNEEKKIGVWGNTVLDSRFEDIKAGCEVKIVYLGVEKAEKSKREYNNFKVYKRQAPFQEVTGDEADANNEAQIASQEE